MRPFSDLQRAAVEAVRELYPLGCEFATEVIVRVSDGRVVKVPVPRAVALRAPPQAEPPPPAEVVAEAPAPPGADRAILDALARAGRPLKRAALAAAAGLSESSYFNHAFARLRREGKIYRPEPAVAAYAAREKPADSAETA